MTTVQKMKWLAGVCVLAVLYGTAARLSLYLAFANTNASPVWPPSGIAFAALLLFGLRLWPGVALGAFAANLLTFLSNQAPLWHAAAGSLVIGAGNTLEAAAGVLLLRQMIGLRNPLSQTSDVFRLLGVVLVMCLIPAMIGPGTLSLLNLMPWELFSTAFLTWWMGDITGILMLIPLFFLWHPAASGQAPFPAEKRQWRQIVEGGGFIVLLLALTLVIFEGTLKMSFLNYPASYLLIPLIVIAAFRFGHVGVGWSIPVISGIAVWGTIQGFGPFVRDNTNQSLLFLQTFIAVMSLTGLVLAAAMGEKLRAQAVLRRNQQDLSDFFENATIGLHRLGPDGIIQWANKAELQMLGYAPEEYIGHHISEFHLDGRKMKDMLARLGRGEIVQNVELQLKSKKGEPREVVMDWNVMSEDGRIVYIRGFVQDITDQKRMQKVLTSQEQWFRASIENSADIITLVNSQGAIIYSSHSTTRILGYPLNEYVGRNIFEFIHLEDLDRITHLFGEVLKKPGNYVSSECRYRHKDGRWIWLEGSGSNLLSDENVQAVVINCRDITARKKTAEALRESEARLKGIFESSKDAICYVDPQTSVFLDVNKAFVDLTGYSKNEVLGHKTFNDITPKEYHQFEKEKIEEILRTGHPAEFEKEYIRKDGSLVPVFLTVFWVPGFAGRPQGLAAIIKDISERKKAEEERYRLAAIVDSSSDAIIGKNLDGIITSWNRAAQDLYGYTAEEMVGRSISILTPPDRQSELRKIFERLQTGEDIRQMETVRLHKNGRAITVSLTISPIKNELGKLTGASTIARDITERKRIEEQLQETARLKTEFTSTVSHELRTPLAISKEALSLLLREKVGPVVPKQREIMTIASSNIDRLCFLIDDILDFSKIEAGRMEIHKEPWDVIPIVKECCDGWKLKADFKKITLQMRAPTGPLTVPVDKIRFIQILSNLLNNASKFTPAGGSIDLIVEDEPEMVRIAVNDSGPGIAPEDMSKLFQKFQQLRRTHGPGARGTGLGLSIVKSLVDLHGGDIEVKSALGKGSSFIFRLPKGVSLTEKKEITHGA